MFPLWRRSFSQALPSGLLGLHTLFLFFLRPVHTSTEIKCALSSDLICLEVNWQCQSEVINSIAGAFFWLLGFPLALIAVILFSWLDFLICSCSTWRCDLASKFLWCVPDSTLVHARDNPVSLLFYLTLHDYSFLLLMIYYDISYDSIFYIQGCFICSYFWDLLTHPLKLARKCLKCTCHCCCIPQLDQAVIQSF